MTWSMLLWASVKIVGLLFLAVPGSLGQIRRVTHIPSKICSLHHTSVVLPCKLTYPSGEVVTTSVWHYKKQADAEPVVVSVVQGSGQHVENCSLTLSNVTQDKAGIYQFSFTTNISTQNLTNEGGVTLEITDLEVDMVSESDIVLEGEWVMLFCGTCIPSLTLPTYIWHKDGRPHSRIYGVNQLELQEAKPEDSGTYSCSIGGQEGLLSSSVNFTVEWAPKNISVSISPSGEIVEGSSVNLTCSSDGNPPVKIYTWFKGSTTVGEGKTYSIPNIRSEDSGEYTCQSRNDHGERRSTAVLIDVAYPPKNITTSISPSGEIVEGSSVNLTCSSDGNPPVKIYTWFKGSTPVGEGKTYNIPNIRSEDSGEYTCQSRNDHGERRSTAVHLDVLYIPKNVSVSISPSGEIVEGSSVTLTCSSDGNPPVKIYTWFKGSTQVGEGKMYSIPNIRSEDSGEYTCQSRNEHGERRSTAVYLNVLYPPENISVSISPLGEIVEGSSVTLTCSSDGNPPVKIYTWFKGSTPVGEGKTYSIPNIRSEDSGEYTCQSRNDHGERRSTAVYLNVLYIPKNVSVSISPSGEIVEGSSVTLTCSSNGNPPVKIYTWFKGSTPVGEGKMYSIPNIRSEDSGEYTCQSRNDHGERRSTAVYLNVLYPPENISVSISPLGEIVEGSSVTLTCSSDGNPPVKIYTWFKGSTPVGEGKTYSIPNIRSEDSGEYTCQSRNDHGERRSTAVYLNVLYIPKNVSVSISPSGEIVKGSSVTLTCNSDGNPPVKIYTWFKGSTPVGEGKMYSIPNITSEHSGEYTCQSRNEHGERRSTAVYLNVLYPPENISVSISPSGEIVESSSVTLTCSSDANPPVKIYTWFKEGGTSPVGSGHNYSFSLNPRSGGLYYCEAQNEHGSLRSASVSVVLNGHSLSLYVIVVLGFCGVVALLAIGFCTRSKRQNQNRKTDNHDFQNADPIGNDDTYTALDLTTRTNDNVYESLGNVHPSPPVYTCISGCSVYENVVTLKTMINTN